MESRVMVEPIATSQVPFAVRYGPVPGQGRLFVVTAPPGSRSPLFWRVMDQELSFTAEDLAQDPVKRGIVVPLASVALTISEPDGGRRGAHPGITQCCQASLGPYHIDNTDSWARALGVSLRMLNGGEALPEPLRMKVTRGFHDILTGNGLSLATDEAFRNDFIQDMRKAQQNTGHLIEGLKTSLADARLLYVINAMVYAYAQALGVFNECG